MKGLSLRQPSSCLKSPVVGLLKQTPDRFGESSGLGLGPLGIERIERHRVFPHPRRRPRRTAPLAFLFVVVTHDDSIAHSNTLSNTLYWWYNYGTNNLGSGEGDMKNGRALKGHRRIEVAIGVPPGRQKPPPGGWNVRCICGWDGGVYPIATQARAAYRAHLDYEIDCRPFRCKWCGIEQNVEEMRHDYRYMCLTCFSKKGNEWQAKHPRDSRRHKRNYHLRKMFGITTDDEQRILAEQGGVCAICGRPVPVLGERGASGHVDHDHATGRVRGILCFSCNAGLGLFRDDISRLRSAIAYLERAHP